MIRKFILAGSMLVTQLQAGIAFTSATASNAAGLQAAVDAFRASIGGGSVAGANGSFGGIRREVNWDGVPDGNADPNLLPATFFVNTSPRGLGMSGPVNGFAVSANPSLATPPLFESFDGAGQGNGTYNFQAFSSNRIFTGIGGTQYDFSFFEPGTGFANPSFVKAFGVVFVDNISQSFPLCGSIQAFNGNTSLGFRCANATTAGGLSFLGVTATGTDVITRVTINQGNAVLGTPQDATHEVVVLDDIIYSEPGLTTLGDVPEPATVVSTLLGLAAAGIYRRRIR